MKKILNLIFITILAFISTGCDKKIEEISCNLNSQNIIINFEDNKATKIIETTEIISTEDFINDMYKNYKEYSKQLNNIPGFLFETIKNSNTQLTINQTIDITKINQEIIQELKIEERYFALNKNPQEILEMYNEKYTCTAK